MAASRAPAKTRPGASTAGKTARPDPAAAKAARPEGAAGKTARAVGAAGKTARAEGTASKTGSKARNKSSGGTPVAKGAGARRPKLAAAAAEPEVFYAGPRRGSLVIVESPAKAKTIKKYLGAGYTVKASVGHIKDLPKKKLGIDVAHDFQPEYVVIDTKKKVVSEIKHAAAAAERVLLAPDPDREGEAIAWHIAEEIRPQNENIQRVLFNEITKKAIGEAIARPMALDLKKYESQQARRVLDRLVGYQISPLLWTKVKMGLSAGRVQSVAVRVVVEREAEIAAFRPEEYWTVEARVEGDNPPPFVAKVARKDGAKVAMPGEGPAREVEELLRAATLRVASVERKERRKFAPPPFITSKLQQEASAKLRFSPKKTMSLAQRLYEGVEVGEEGPVGLITYMRTDSTRLSDDAVKEVRAYIAEKYGPASMPAEPIVYKSKKQAQDAHEAIRPTSTKFDPDAIRAAWAGGKGGGRDERESEDLIKLYALIWNRFVACQMNPAVFDQTSVEIDAGRIGLRASGQVMKVKGFLGVYDETVEDAAADDAESGALPEVREGEILRLLEIKPEQHFTQPPPRFSEATLVKELEERGIGRPSTYAAILSTIQDRGYTEKVEGRLKPTELGTLVNGLLVKSFPEIVSSDFTAQMEEKLDKVEEGAEDWVEILRGFYGPFEKEVARAKVEMRNVKAEEIPTEHSCEKCGKPMVIKWGRNGRFLACTGYPECKNTKEFVKNPDGSVRIVETTRPANMDCPTCGSPMLIRRGRFGEFMACSRYPDCKTTSPLSLGVTCPKCAVGYLTEKRSKRGKAFYGCSNWKRTGDGCDFVLWDKPVPTPCPKCAAPFLLQKVSKAGTRLRCIKEGCGYTDGGEGEEAGAPQDAQAAKPDALAAAPAPTGAPKPGPPVV